MKIEPDPDNRPSDRKALDGVWFVAIDSNLDYTNDGLHQLGIIVDGVEYELLGLYILDNAHKLATALNEALEKLIALDGGLE